jgi:hypothetical protein
MATLTDLPDETICRIVHCLRDDRKSLRRLARTNWRLCVLSRATLWETFRARIDWADWRNVSRIPKRIHNILKHPHLVALIRHIRIREIYSCECDEALNSDGELDYDSDYCTECNGRM